MEQPDFDNPDKLKRLIEAKLMMFAEDMNSLLETGECMQLKEMKKELIAPITIRPDSAMNVINTLAAGSRTWTSDTERNII